ncbi:hypothetical protein SAVIM40S_07699 [Streptomyces avidinii]
MKRTPGAGARATTLGMTHPAWLAPHRPMRAGSISGRVRAAQESASVVSRARSSMVWPSQSAGLSRESEA